MSRRQALGVISNNHSNNQLASTNHLKPQQHPLKTHSSFTGFNNENENVCMTTKSSCEFDFEIFQDKENVGSKKMPVIFSNDYDDDEDNDDVETDEDEEVVVLDEEGICRLNLNSDSSSKLNTSELNSIMDSSNTDGSPMVLDDTIKFSSDSSELQEEDCESEEAKQNQLIEERENLLVNCNEYKDEILAYMRQEEKENRPKANYMKKQQDITNSMRSILVDWLVEVSEEYKLNTETLYLAVNYTDRFLSQMSVLRGKLQLVGTAGMYIAAKYEEISPPDVTEFVYITDDTYTKKQVLRMEHLLLKVLDFRMNTPTTNCFLTHYLRFLKMSGLSTSDKVEHLAKYLSELTLIDSETYLGFLPSQIASSAIYIALLTFGKKWTKEIADQLGYDVELGELKECIVSMHKSMQEAPNSPQQAIQEKYKSSRLNSVSSIEAVSLPAFLYQ